MSEFEGTKYGAQRSLNSIGDADGPKSNAIKALHYLGSRRKRALDVIIALPGLVVVAAIFIPVALAIKVSSRGSILYRQRRVGWHDHEFDLIKFRSMSINAENDGVAIWAAEQDARITWVGGILRRTYVDELPQLWNVLRGEMSIVGPRPERPELIDMIVDIVPSFVDRTMAKPGMTGLAQVRMAYANSIEESRTKARLDLLYIRTASTFVDLKLIVRTFGRIVSRSGT